MENQERTMFDVVDKWGRDVAERGFVQIPMYLLNINRFLNSENKLSPIEILVLFQLVGNWWKKDENPYPSISSLASRCGVSTRQVQRSINNLNGIGLIERTNRKRGKMITSNSYNLKPLVEFLKEISDNFPNEYPRKVTIDDKSKLTSILLNK